MVRPIPTACDFAYALYLEGVMLPENTTKFIVESFDFETRRYWPVWSGTNEQVARRQLAKSYVHAPKRLKRTTFTVEVLAIVGSSRRERSERRSDRSEQSSRPGSKSRRR